MFNYERLKCCYRGCCVVENLSLYIYIEYYHNYSYIIIYTIIIKIFNQKHKICVYNFYGKNYIRCIDSTYNIWQYINL